MPQDVRLKAKTKKAKQIIARHGDVWAVNGATDKVMFSNSPGPWVLVTVPGDFRWINVKADDNFEIEFMEVDD